MSDFAGEGKVWLEGEAWAARSDKPVTKDQKVVVKNLVGLTLEIEPKK
jgi:membrane protein implicated in regulation of membrane protease activity